MLLHLSGTCGLTHLSSTVFFPPFLYIVIYHRFHITHIFLVLFFLRIFSFQDAVDVEPIAASYLAVFRVFFLFFSTWVLPGSAVALELILLALDLCLSLRHLQWYLNAHSESHCNIFLFLYNTCICEPPKHFFFTPWHRNWAIYLLLICSFPWFSIWFILSCYSPYPFTWAVDHTSYFAVVQNALFCPLTLVQCTARVGWDLWMHIWTRSSIWIWV